MKRHLPFALIFAAIVCCGCAGPDLQPIQRAAFDHNKAEVDRLLKQGGNLNFRFGEGRETLLYAFAFEGDADMVEFLISRGADPTIGASWKDYETPLHKAAEKGYPDVIKILLAHGVNVDIQDRFGNTSLIFAIKYQQPEAVKLLLDAGANLELKDEDGETAPTLAKRLGNEKIQKLISNHLKDYRK